MWGGVAWRSAACCHASQCEQTNRPGGLAERISPCSASPSPLTHCWRRCVWGGGGDGGLASGTGHLHWGYQAEMSKRKNVTCSNDFLTNDILVFSPSWHERIKAAPDVVDCVYFRRKCLSSRGFHQHSDIHTRLPHREKKTHTPNCRPLRSATGATEEEEEEVVQGRWMLLLRGPSTLAAELVQIWTDIPLVTSPQQGWQSLLVCSCFTFSVRVADVLSKLSVLIIPSLACYGIILTSRPNIIHVFTRLSFTSDSSGAGSHD